jgi:hypothetical protein
MKFNTMCTQLAGLREVDRGVTMSQPTRPKDLGQEAHCPSQFKRYVIDKSCKIGSGDRVLIG